MNESDFISRFEEESPMLEAWGKFVISVVEDRVTSLMQAQGRLEPIIRYPSYPRLKKIESALEKAFVRKKDKYTDPYEDMTDKVGVRFITLLTDEIDDIKTIIEDSKDWNASRDKDFVEEQKISPEVFGYQSMHYVVSAVADFNYQGVSIKKGTPCEIQIRTMLQHVYSELTHGTIYKPSVQTTHEVKRYIARSMALLETTDEMLCKAKSHISDASQSSDALTREIRQLYGELFSLSPSTSSPVEQLIIDCYRDEIEADFDKIKSFYTELKPALCRLIKKKAASNIFYRQSAILVVYYLVADRHMHIKQTWPVGSAEKELEAVYTDLGIAYAHD